MEGERSNGNVTVRWSKKTIASLSTGKPIYVVNVNKYVDGQLVHMKSKSFDRSVSAQNFIRRNRNQWLSEGK